MNTEKIAVVGAGVVGIPMAAALASAPPPDASAKPARVLLIQRNSPTSGWKVGAINAGRSPLGGIEPGLEPLIRRAAAAGTLQATSDFSALGDAGAILFCVQTDKRGLAPDYGPLMEAVSATIQVLRNRPAGRQTLIIFESTLAPTTMQTVMRKAFADHGLADGRDILLANSPNRVMPGFLLERIRTSDKLIGGLRPETAPAVARLYASLVSSGRLHLTNCLTAETVKTFENACRDVRIACAAELVRLCDGLDVDFHALRGEVNRRLAWEDNAPVPAGGLLVPTIGVGGHCLPKDGVLLLWRMIEAGRDMSGSLLLQSRRINDASPAYAADRLAELWGPPAGKKIALLGTAYRPNSEDTRNSPTLALATVLAGRGAAVVLHDPYVRPGDQNLERTGLAESFTRDLDQALFGADGAVICAAHDEYRSEWPRILRFFPETPAVFDGCRLFSRSEAPDIPGLGKGRAAPPPALIDFALAGFQAVERGLALEMEAFAEFINADASDDHNRLDLREAGRLAATCVTGCRLAAPAPVDALPVFQGSFLSLAEKSLELSRRREKNNP